MRPRVVTLVEPDSEQHKLSLAAYVRERGDWLARCAYLLTRDHDEALDLVQETLLLAWKAVRRVEEADDRDAYVLRIMLNRYRSGRRRRVPVTISIDLPMVDAISSLDPTGAIDTSAAIAQALGRLSDRQRAVVVFRYWLDLDDTRIAEVLGCRRTTVRSLAARGMEKIRQHLESP